MIYFCIEVVRMMAGAYLLLLFEQKITISPTTLAAEIEHGWRSARNEAAAAAKRETVIIHF